MQKLLLLFLICMMCTACESGPTTSRSALSVSQYVENPGTIESLFPGDATVLSDGDIERILKYAYVPPARARVVVLPLGRDYWFGYSDELDKAGKEIRDKFISQLKSSQDVSTVAYLPALLIPVKRSVAAFREAAARYQADVMVVYQNSCRTYEKYRMFNASKSKSYCNVEALILDVRTGLVPFSTAATQEMVVEQTGDDMSLAETMRRSELKALGGALDKVGMEISSYLETH